MNVRGASACLGSDRGRLFGNLADAAVPVALRHGVRGSPDDVELDVWQALSEAAKTGNGRQEECPSKLAAAVYEVALRRGFSDSFIDLELDLWQTMRHALHSMPA